nr:MAG: RNA-dependent RNA polymerase [Wufeng shrew peropuvirus 1]
MNPTFLYPRHLDVALSLDKLSFYFHHPSLWNDHYPCIPTSFILLPENGRVRGHYIFHWMYQHIKLEGAHLSSKSTLIWDQLLSNSGLSLDSQGEALFSEFPGFIPHQYSERLRDITKTGRLRGVFHIKYLISQIHYSISAQSSQSNPFFVIKECPTVEFHRDMVVLRSYPGGPIVLPFVFFLSVLDRLEAEFAYNVYVLLKDSSPFLPSVGYLDLTDSLSLILWQVGEALGNEAARVYKTLEPVCLGVCLELLSPISNDTTFLATLLVSLEHERPNVYNYVLQVANYLRSYLDTHGEAGIPAVLEQYGHEKRFFYPIVDEEGGLKKMFKYGTEVRPIDRDFVQELKGLAIVDYSVAYYNKHGVLPPIVFDVTLNPKILDIFVTGSPQSAEYCMTIPLVDWSHVLFKEHVQFNYYEDVTFLLDDKAISPHRLNWRQIFAYDALKILGQAKMRSREQTKLILLILEREEIDIREFYRTVEDLGYLDHNWTLIQAMAKERELKIEARMFSILVLEIRMMCSAAEHNIKEGVFPLFPQQSITMSGPELKQVLESMVSKTSDDEFIWVVFNLDLEQWNYTFRFPLEYPIASVLCRIFGKRHFVTVLAVFLESLILSSQKFSPPGTPGKFTYWDTHIGGNQGIFQALWSWITILVERWVLKKTPYLYYELGSGDNRSLLVRFPNHPGVKEDIDAFRAELRHAFERVGLSLKEEETWYSSSIMAYQRKYWFKGVQCENGIKQSNRAYAGGADVALGVEEMVTTAMNGGLTIAEVTVDPIIGPTFSYLEGLGAIVCHPGYSNSTLSAGPRLAILTWFNTDFGYYPFTQLIGFLYSGHPDPLTNSLALIKKIWALHPELQEYISPFLTWTRNADQSEAMLHLASAPHSLYLKKPTSITAILKDAVQSHLFTPGVVKNRKIRSLLTTVRELDKASFMRQLATVRPVNSSLLHALLETSQIGQVEGMVNHFNRVSSLVHTVNSKRVTQGGLSFQETVNQTDKGFLSYISSRVRIMGCKRATWEQTIIGPLWVDYTRFCFQHHFLTQCSFSVRLFLVSYTHYLAPELVLGVYLPSPIEQTVLGDLQDSSDIEHGVIVSSAANTPIDRVLLHSTRGPFKPLLGSTTANPARTLRLSSLQGMEVSKAIRELLKILAWLSSVGSDSQLLEYVVAQLDSKIAGIGELASVLVTGTRGGTFEHRFSIPGQVMGSYNNNLSTVSTWFQFSTNSATALQRGEEDRFVYFQGIFQFISAGLRFCSYHARRWLMCVRVDHCGYLIPKNPFTCPGAATRGLIPDPQGALLSPAAAASLIKEAQHLMTLYYLPAKAHGYPVESLCAVIAHQFSRVLKSYQLGSRGAGYEGERVGTPQSAYNVTVLRKVPLKTLITSIALHCLHHHTWTTSNSPAKLRHILQSMIVKVSTFQDTGPYLPLIEGLITAGHLPGLVVWTNTPCKWTETNLHGHLVNIFIRALCLGLERLESDPSPLVLLVEAQKPNYHWGILWRTLRQFNRNFSSWMEVNPNPAPEFALHQYYLTEPSIKCWFTSDYRLVEEYARTVVQSVTFRGPAVDTSLFGGKTTVPSLPQTFEGVLSEGSFQGGDNPNQEEVEQLLSVLEHNRVDHSSEYYRVGRWGGSASSARVKLLEILPLVQSAFKVESLHMCLAEGAGSYASLILHFDTQSMVVYNSLLPPESLPHCFSTHFIPFECLCVCGVHNRIIGTQLTNAKYGDLQCLETWAELGTIAEDCPLPKGLLTFDMEGYSGSKSSVLEQLSDFVRAEKPQAIVIKLFLQDLLSSSLTFISELASSYKSIRLVKPKASHFWSSEWYLVGWRPVVVPSHSGQLDATKFVRQWLNQSMTMTATLGWKRACSTARMWNDHHLCPRTFPSTQSQNPPEYHPLAQNLLNLTKSLLWLVLEPASLGQLLPRGTSHMMLSRSRGTMSSQSYISVIIVYLDFICTWGRISSSPINGQELSKLISNRTAEDLEEVNRLPDLLLYKEDFTPLLKLIGETIGSPDILNPYMVQGTLCAFLTILQVLPDSFPIQVCKDWKPPTLLGLGDITHFRTHQLGAQLLLSHDVQKVIKRMLNYPRGGNTSQVLSVHANPTQLLAVLVIVEALPVYYYKPEALVVITDRTIVPIVAVNPKVSKFHIQWGKRAGFSEEEQKTVFSPHNFTVGTEEYFLGLWKLR